MKKPTLLILSLVLAGCSNTPELKPMDLQFDEIDATNDAIIKALDSLTESASMAAEANQVVAQLAIGKANNEMTPEEYERYIAAKDYIPAGMEREFDINYTGPVLPVLRSIAAVSGYVLAEPANKPIVEPIVSINNIGNPLTGTKNNYSNTVIDAIRSINASHKDRVSIKIHEKLRIIELNYK